MDCPTILPPSTAVAPSVPPPLPLPEPPTARPAVVYHGIDSRKLTFAEWWRLAPGLNAVVGCISKIFNAQILGGARALAIRDSAALEISANQLPEEVGAKMLPHIEASRPLGFGAPYFMRVLDVCNNLEMYLGTQPHEAGEAVARVIYSRPMPGAKAKTRLICGYLTALPDGRFVSTTDTRPKILEAPVVVSQACNAPAATLWQIHQRTLATVGCEPIEVRSAEQIYRITDAYERAADDFQTQRGLHVPLTDEQGATVGSISSPEEARRTATLTELTRLQTAKPKSMAGLILLVVSLALFAGAGSMQWSWQICAVIATALFVHELGHYLAMRCFKYRELRMFFIPLLGAAVIGKNHNVAGWKKAVVSLMGPVPGIVIGTVLAIYAAFAQHQSLAEASMLIVGLNVFNLLPFVPLDGGWLWNSVLFCRHRWLEAGFQLIAGLLGVAVALATTKFFLFVAIPMLMAVPRTLRVGGVAARLRKAGWQQGEDAVSTEAADTIIAELTQAHKTTPVPKIVAAEALSVFEHLNARPPNWLESFGLAGVYFGSIVVALIGLGAGSLALKSGANDAAAAAAPAPYVPILEADFRGELAQTPASLSSDVNSQPMREVIATFADSAAAAVVFGAIQTEPAPTERVIQFGQTVITTTPHKQTKRAKNIAERLTVVGGKVLDTGDQATTARFDLQFSAPTPEVAEQMKRDLEVYFALPNNFRPPAPWDEDASLTPEQRQALLKAAATYARVLDVQKQTVRDPEFQRMTRGSPLDLFRRGKDQRARWEAMRVKRQQLSRDALLRLQQSNDRELDARVIETAMRQPDLLSPATQLNAREAWTAEMRQLLTGRGEESADEESLPVYVHGVIAVSGARVTLHSMAFGRTEVTLPAIAKYLSATGCTEVHYAFYNAETSANESFAHEDE